MMVLLGLMSRVEPSARPMRARAFAGVGAGVVVVPVSVAGEAAAYGAEHEDLETYLRERVRAGAALSEAYPPNEVVKAEYERVRKERG